VKNHYFFHKDDITRIRTQLLPFYEVSNDDLKFIGNIVNPQGKVIPFRELFANHNRLLVYNCMSFKDWPCVGCTAVCQQFNSCWKYLDKHAATAIIAHTTSKLLHRAFIEYHNFTIPCFAALSENWVKFCNLEDRSTDPQSIEWNVKTGTSASPGLTTWYWDKDSDKLYLCYQSYMRGFEDVESFFGWSDRIPFQTRKDREHPEYPFYPPHKPDNTSANNNCCDPK